MGIYRKVLRYGLKKQAEASQGSLARTADRLRILSSVLAAGFVVLPFFCGEAFAAGSIVRVDSDKNLMQSGRADIYAESVHGDVGLNRFKDFKVENQELANLYFQQAKDSAVFNTLVNTVDSRIDINGTVNAIRDNKVGGNLYFLSKDGMIVGTSGVVNAGSLTVLAAENSFENAKAASEALQKQNWELSSKGTIDVSGTLNTATGIDLRAAYINVAKAKGSSFAPQLRTGMLFYTTVNTDGLVSNAAVKDGRLTATVDSSGNIVIADPNDADNAALKGDGSIKLQASATKKNAAQMFLNSDSLKNTVEAKVNIAEGAKLDAAGDVLVSAEATHDSNRNVVEILDIAAFAKADVKVDGELKGRNITVTANAVNSLDSKNLKSIYDGLDRTAEEITNAMGYKITVNDALADAIGSTLEDRGVFGKGGKYFDTVNNVIEQLYMPFGFANAEATISVGSAGKFTASENISAAANSTASNNFKVEIQPKLQQGDANKLKYFTGGFVYVDTDSKATVNIYGKLKAEKNLAVTAKAVDTSIGTMVVKPPRILDNGQGGDSKDDGSFYTGLAMAMNFQNSAAVVNLGTAGSAAKDKNNPLLKAGGALTVNAVNVNTLASTASITVKENTPLNTAINISSTQGKAVINDNAALEGAQVQLNSKHMLNKLSVTADSSIGPELSGSQWVVNTPQAKHGLDELRKFLSGVNEGPKVSAAAGPNIKKDKKTWDQYFNFGMSFGLALVDNEARTNIAAGVPITATGGNLALTAAVSIGDSQFATKNLLNAANRDDPLGVSAAIGVEDMHNTAEVNAAEDSGSELAAKGNINITANVDNSYQRVNKLVDAVKSGWESFYNYWSTGGKLEDDAASDAKAKVQQIETIVADILTMASKNSAEAFVKDKQFAMKSKAAMEILTELTGATELKNALENLLNASNYANMYVSTSTDKPLMSKPDITTMITGTVGVQNLANNAKVNIGAHKRLTAGADVALAASVTEQNALLAGKWQLIPDIFTNDAGQNGLGASVGVQNAANKSEVRVNNGVGISAGSGAVAMQTANDIINTSLVMGGAKTSSLGITGMVNYVGGSSAAETLVDDDVSLSAAKKLRLAAANDTVLTAVTGDFGYSQGSSVGVSTSVIDYNVKTLAQLRNLEGTDSAGKGSITASALEVNAHTDGVINNFALAGVASKSSNVNKDAGGVSTSTSDGKAKEGVEKAEVKAEEKKDDTSAGGSDKNDDKVQGTLRAGGDKKNDSKKLEESVIKVDAAGSVAWNYVKDETDASIDNVQIELLRPAGTDKTTSVAIAAEDSSYIGAYSGSAALSKFGFAGEKASSTKFEGMLSGAIAVNDVHKSTTSALRRAEFNNADNVTNLAQNSGAQAAAGLAMGVELGKRAGSVDINLGGSGSANYVDSTVLAEMTGNVMKNGALNVSNVAYDKDVQAGGGINFEFSRGNAAAGAAISISDVDNKISAVMQDNRIGTQDKLAGSISNLALSNLVQVGTATSIGVLVGSKAYFMGDVAIAVNMVDNDVQAQADSNTIYAQSVANEARDGKLQVNEKQNKYIDAINSTADNGITVEKETGKFYKLDANGSKQYIVGEGASYVYEDNGAAADLYDANNKISYDETTGKLTDSHGRTLVFNSKRSFVDEKTKAGVDVTAAAAANILDLDAQAALAQANGSQGVALGAEENKDGSLTYKSKTLTAESAGNVIVGSAIAVAAKASEGSYGGSAAVATNINHIKNSFNAAASDNNITASGKDGVKITAASDTLMVAVAAGAAASAGTDKVSVDLAGSGVDNTLHNDTLASLTGGNIKADNVEAVSSTKSLLVGVAGQLSAVITGQYGGAAGLTWAQSDLDNTTGAYVSGLKLTGYNGKNKLFKAEAINDSSIVTVGAGVSAALASGAATGAYAGSYGKNDTKAVVDGDSSIESAGSIEVSAKDNSSINTAAGSIELAGSKDVAVTVGGAVVNTQLGRHVQAQLNDTQLELAKNTTINVLANDKSSTLNLALGGGVAIGGEMAGVAAQGSVAVLSADGVTQATFDKVKLQAEADAAAVSVKANSDNRLTNSADALAIGGGGLGGGALGAAVSVLTNSRDTVAQAKGGSWRAGAALVQANSKTKVEHVTTGVSAAAGAEGAGALTASVQVNVLEDKTEAYVQQVQGSVKSLTVNADRNMDIAAYNNGFALTASMISGSVGAGVTTVDDKASILAGLADSKLQRADKSADVKVTAKNKTSIETEVSSNNMALSLGAAIGTGVEVVNLEAQTAALVKNSQLGDSKNAFHNIDITADNEVSNKFTNVVDSTASLAGVAVGVGVANINTQTTTTVDGSKLYADNIKVTADERRTADAQLVGAAIGGLAVGVNLMYTNLGGELQDAYTYDVWNENKQSYDTYTTYTQATDSVEKQYVTDIQGIAGEGLTGTNAALKALPADSVAEVKLNKGSAAGKVGVNIKGSTLEAGQAVQAAAHGTNNVNSDIRQAAVAGASVAVAGNHTRFREEQSVQLAEAIIKGKSVDISSLTDGNIKHYTGQGGFSIEAYSDTVSYIKHSGANKLQINGSTITATDKATLSAQNKVQLDNKALAVNIGGVSAGRLVLESKDSLAAGVELVFVHTGRDTSYGGDEEGGYVTEDTGSKHYNKLDKNSVDINGSMAAGMDNRINIVVGAAGDIALFDEDERKSLTNKTALSKEELQGKITVAGSEVLDAQGKPTGAHSGLTEETAATIKDSIKLGSVDYAQTLMNRYNEIMLLISEYASDGADSASYIGYKAEAERLLSQMEKMGEVSYVDGKYVLNARKMVDYVEIPELTASGGNIAINTSVLKSSKATGSLAANGSPEINVTNNTNLMLRLQRINVDDGGGRLLYNNEQLTGSTSSDFNNNISKLNKKDNAASGGFQSVKSETGIGGSINIKGNYSGAPLDYRVVEDGKTFYGQYLPQADIIVSGDVYNKNGSIKITSQNNNITIAGASAQDSVSVLGASVALSAGGSITQTFTDGIVNIDHDPRQFFNKQYDKLKKDKKNIYDITGPNGEPYDGMEPTGSFIAGGVISINATDINVDGIVQSGYGDYGLWMSNDKNVEAAINKIKSSYKEGDKLTDDYVKGNDAYQIVKGSAYWDYDAKCYKYRIGAYYNPASNTIILEDVNASGGQIYLTGRISSIGAGRLYCLDGTSNITIESNLPYNMKLGSLITNDVKGRVSITDTAGYSVSYNNKKIPVARVTEYTNGMMETYYVSSGGTKYEYMATYFDGGKGGEYKPKAGLRYTWTTGTKNTDYKRYTHDDMDGGWGLWDLEEKDKDLQEWSTQENLTGSGSSANEARKDGVVVQETNDTRKTFMEYEHNQLGETVRTIESERYYSTGLFGCHKHHEVTWKEETGSTDTYFASAKADYPIEVKFLGQKAEESAVKVHNVMGGIEMSGSIGNTQLYEGTDAAGNITHNTKGTVLINSGRIDVGEPVKQSGGALYGRIISVAGTGNLENINIAAGDDVYLKLKSWSQAGGEVKVNVSNLAGAKGRLHLDANSGELSESGYRWKLLDITNSSSNGDIIYAGNNAIEADRINLTAANGSIYGDGSDGSAMKIKAGQNAAGDDSLSASINVKAKGDINIEQVEGNLRLGRVYSSTGDVTLKSAGSIIDALPEEAAAKGSEESRLQRWKNIGLIEGGNSRLQEIKSRLNQEKGLDSYAAWDKTALLYAVSESILQKTAESLDQTSTKDPNVIGRNITLTANGSVGQRGETKEITLTGILAKNADGSYKNANALNDLKTLGQADVTNVTLRKAADGKQIAVIDETQTLGIQQTTSNGQGKINIQAAAKGGQGDIFLQGREEVSLEKSFAGRASKDLNIETLMTGNGRATVTSLGSINKLAAEPEAVNIQAQSLYLTAINGVGSTGALNVSLYGQDEANDGLSVISGGAVAINQLGDKQLVLQHLSTGKDAGSYLKILADNDIVLHGDAPDSESITLQSRGGSITAGELTGNDITLSARKGSLDIDRLEAQGLLRAEAERMHFGDASIGHGSIRPGREAVFDRLRTNGLAQFHNVSQYQVYDLGDGLQLRLTAGGRSPYDALVQFDNALHEFCSQRLYATGVLGTKLEYDVHEKLFGPQIRPGILFDRYNLIEQEEAEEKI